MVPSLGAQRGFGHQSAHPPLLPALAPSPVTSTPCPTAHATPVFTLAFAFFARASASSGRAFVVFASAFRIFARSSALVARDSAPFAQASRPTAPFFPPSTRRIGLIASAVGHVPTNSCSTDPLSCFAESRHSQPSSAPDPPHHAGNHPSRLDNLPLRRLPRQRKTNRPMRNRLGNTHRQQHRRWIQRTR